MNTSATTSIKQGEKGFVDSAADLARDAKNMVSDIMDITKETITEKAHESKMQKPEDKGIAGLAAEFAKGVGDMVSDAVEGTKEIVAAHNPNNIPVATNANVQAKPLTSSDAALIQKVQEQHGDDVEITITKVTVKGLAGDKAANLGSNQSGDSASELVHDARSMINNAVESGNVTTAGTTPAVPATSVADSAKEFAKNVRDVITDAFQNTKELAAEKGLGDSASKLASDVKATVENTVNATKEKVSQAADQLAHHLTDTPTHGVPVKTETMIELEKKTA